MTDWRRVRLDECCTIVGGATPSTSVTAYWNGDICWATPRDLSDLEGAVITDTPRKLTKEGLASCAADVLPAGAVLFSSRAPIGHVAINTVPMATNQGFKSFIPKHDLLHAKFLCHWLRRNRSYLESLGNGATFKEVSKAVVSRIEISLPPLPERSSGGLRRYWTGRRHCGPSAAPLSPNSTPSPNPSSSTCSATPPRIRRDGRFAGSASCLDPRHMGQVKDPKLPENSQSYG